MGITTNSRPCPAESAGVFRSVCVRSALAHGKSSFCLRPVCVGARQVVDSACVLSALDADSYGLVFVPTALEVPSALAPGNPDFVCVRSALALGKSLILPASCRRWTQTVL